MLFRSVLGSFSKHRGTENTELGTRVPLGISIQPTRSLRDLCDSVFQTLARSWDLFLNTEAQRTQSLELGSQWEFPSNQQDPSVTSVTLCFKNRPDTRAAYLTLHYQKLVAVQKVFSQAKKPHEYQITNQRENQTIPGFCRRGIRIELCVIRILSIIR